MPEDIQQGVPPQATSSHMMKTTKRGRPFLKDTLDLFATLIVSLDLTTHKQFFKSFHNSFTTDEAALNLAALKFSQSNRGPDPRDPSRIVTTTTTTTFSMTRDMAKAMCQHFMDARLIENAADRNSNLFKERGVFVLTPKGLHVLERFISKNGISAEPLAKVFSSQPICLKLLHLERRSSDDEIIISQAVVTALFRRFAGRNSNYMPDVTVPLDASQEYHERSKGIPLIDVSERQAGIIGRTNVSVFKFCFQAVTALEWLCDFTSIVGRDEAAEMAAHFVRFGLIALVSDKRKGNDSAIIFTVRGSAPAGNSPVSQQGEFRCTSKAIYRITDEGRRVARWDSPASRIGGRDSPNASNTNISKDERSSLERKEESTSVSEHVYPAKTESTTDVRLQRRVSVSDRPVDAPRRGGKESNTDRLRYILNEPAVRSLFRDFLRTNFCEENLSFWIEVEDFKRKFNTTSSALNPQRLHLGKPSVATEALGSTVVSAPQVPKHETSYTKILEHVFSERLEIANAPDFVPTHGALATTPEFALGRVRKQLEERQKLVKVVEALLEASPAIPSDLHALLSKWLLARDDSDKSRALGEKITAVLEANPSIHSVVPTILALHSHFPAVSRWIIGSDSWSYDLGASGLHHLIASGLNVNTLILDTVPYSYRNSSDHLRRKRDVGLYAMNHSDVYVASVAVYSSYTQVLQALTEADRFNGPSVVLAYLPYQSEDATALEVLKETKLAVDTGYWPLYRWDPAKEKAGKEPFALDSDAVKQELRDFLDRQNHISQLTRSKPELATELVSSLGESVKEARRKRAQQAYEELLNKISGAPLLVLYASDGGAAEKKAKRLANRGKARGLATTVATIDSVSIDDLVKEEYVAFITSVAGQGEPPQNGRTFFKALNAAASRGETPLTSVKYSVFGMGDSHYWPRAEDAHYYNKSGKDLDARLTALGATRFADLGLGDDQDADGPETGYKVWEPLVWKALGVDTVEVTEAEPDPITNEHMKIASNFLRGTIAEGLADTTTGALAASDTQLTKFHGIYQQDDRDIRDERQAQGAEPAYSFMIRVRMPGGVCSPEQWTAMDKIADEHGNGTFKITTRQTYQFHGVIKRHLKQTIKDINRALLDTLAACGDVNRNVITSAIPTKSQLHADVYEFAKDVSERLLPRTSAYHEIWLDKKLVAGDAVHDFEPLYGEFYLPRKFKVAVAVPPTNDVDVFANDLGFIAIVDKDGRLDGFNVTAGGGMGVTHGNKKTYPRLGSILGFCTPAQGLDVAEKVMLVQRDNGNRADRKNARLKYTIDRMGLDVFKGEVEKLLGWSLAPARPYTFDRNIDDFGWSTGQNGKHNFMMYIENGRVQNEPGREFKKGLLEIAKVHKGTFRMTANQHLMLADVPSEELPRIKAMLAEYKLDNLNFTGLRLASSACVAFPTCGLAMAESERYLPILINKVEAICEENGLRNDSIVMRMTGCPNGCARPYVAEVAFVGKAPGTYLMLLGGGYYGQRLNKIYRESVSEPEILAILRPMIKHYALERHEGEHFGDFVVRAGYISATTSGKEWYEGMGGLGPHREISAAA